MAAYRLFAADANCMLIILISFGGGNTEDNADLHSLPFYSATALLAMQSAVLATAIPSICLSVRPSVRLSHASTLSRRINVESRGLHCELAKTL